LPLSSFIQVITKYRKVVLISLPPGPIPFVVVAVLWKIILVLLQPPVFPLQIVAESGRVVLVLLKGAVPRPVIIPIARQVIFEDPQVLRAGNGKKHQENDRTRHRHVSHIILLAWVYYSTNCKNRVQGSGNRLRDIMGRVVASFSLRRLKPATTRRLVEVAPLFIMPVLNIWILSFAIV
jgi:hypothetical protein